ncbi:mitogen-activated protein kinase kinase kinase 4 isoform X1 [Ooceraea biroi]|uniref:mitogen-activated protein kinase kinase kinase 4 isoform X1 n=1 Tax=Ooceraea biroi TaxID=2015173 RepID=UPI000F08AB84|nr:mitogen-activated protein kinase kinase kinase 4 isoform X1 [Ooceraea biroi]
MPRRCRPCHSTRKPDYGPTDNDDVDHAAIPQPSSPTSELEESLHAMSDIYGQTPPRTRLSRKKKYMKQKFSSSDLKSTEKEAQPNVIVRRRNTLDTIIFNEMCDKADKDCEDETKEDVKESGRKCKRSLKLLRGNERDLKLDIEIASYDKCCGNIAIPTPNQIKVETRNRFRSLRSKPVDMEEKKVEQEISEEQCTAVINEDNLLMQSPRMRSFKEREIFYNTFAFLIKLKYFLQGSMERNRCRQISHEETRWQNELKDLIWLELQAHHADRSPMAQDEYLCRQREAVNGLLAEIMEYRYNPIADTQEGGPGCISPGEAPCDRLTNLGLSPSIELGVCPGCLSMYCRACARVQREALEQVEGLLARLESAEALYPSSQAFAANYPLYKSAEFTDKVKAMCLWYNMTKHHRFKLQILGRLLMLHTSQKKQETTDSGISSSRSSAVDTDSMERQSVVRFEIPHQDETSSPSDSNNSNNSSAGALSLGSAPHTPEISILYFEDERVDRLDFYLVEFDRHGYRKYIEDVLKTRGLRKSLNFLDRLHTSVLRKARLTLEKNEEDEEGNSSAYEEYEGDRELRRYGAWSPEARELNLPSYRSAFVFLSRVPLDVVHEFLRMRLEQKPEQPSPLSVRQLMRELREGLRIACIHRDRFATHSRAAVASDNGGCESLFEDDLKHFDESVRAVFEVYLDYLQQWVDMVQHDSFHKNLIMDEWLFVKSIAGDISNGYKIASVKFCEIARMMIKQVNEFLIDRPREIRENADEKEDDDELSSKFHLMFVGREWQGMFVEAREKVVKSVNLVKHLKCDIEKWTIFDSQLMESLTPLKDIILDLRRRITLVIEDFQNDANEVEQSNTESEYLTPLRSRIREILHQAYRMGFDFHKEMYKLFSSEEKAALARGLVSFALLWMEFVRTRCERGRGLRPTWANQGLDFLMTICEPHNTKYLTDQEFEELKACMDRCISHVIGTASGFAEGPKSLSRSRGTSPCHSRSRTTSINFSQKSRDPLKSPEILGNAKKCSSPSMIDGNLAVIINTPERNTQRHERIVSVIRRVENELDERRQKRDLIGQVIDRKTMDTVRVKRRVTFTWQRGIKIGQGRFGKVYTVVNNQTGELLAMKEVQLKPGDHAAIRNTAEELQIFEGIQHPHLVRYYGLEIRRKEMLIFMEFCAEGTLENLVAGSGNGLPESLVRKYTYQLLLAIAALHSHGIVHRDVKTANIFLTDEGNCLKLGDFGCAVQIKAHMTMPGELHGFVGTQAYMAPEVFMKSESTGYGRIADIWSVGCCVIEMASGRQPWSDFDSNYQIMFKVGMGQIPALPKNLSAEGIDLVKKCLQHDPKKRWPAESLLSHSFVRGEYEDVNADLTMPRY